jgi:hypothetical protein
LLLNYAVTFGKVKKLESDLYEETEFAVDFFHFVLDGKNDDRHLVVVHQLPHLQ